MNLQAWTGPRAGRACAPGGGNLNVLLALLGTLWMCFPFSAVGAEQKDEQQLIQLLQSNSSVQEKDTACVRLKRIGTEQCVPALASLLTDEQLSHSARHALESLPFPTAGAALVKALEGSAGLTRLGIINSLAVRREAQAIPALAKLLSLERAAPALRDEQTVISAAAALGEIATPAAIRALELAVPSSSGVLNKALADALLRSANRLLASGNA